MKIEKCSTLEEIASNTYWEPDYEIEAEVIDKALTQAGFRIQDGKERVRFYALVKDCYYQRQQDKIAELGRYYEKAKQNLDEGSSIEEIISEAEQLKDDEEESESENW